MLSYRHAYHAGNFADVLKHAVLQYTLRYLTEKDKPITYIDTHSGAGGYRLDSDVAAKTAEYKEGVNKLWHVEQLPPILADYMALIKEFNYASQGKTLSHYPGSPWFAQHLLRTNDRLLLSELHSTDFNLLNKHFRQDARIKLFDSDGYVTLNASLPPLHKRALVLIDPSYEEKKEYQWVIDHLLHAHKKFATGTYALWYPVVDRRNNDRLEKALRRSGIPKIQLFELGMQADNDEYGMTASGMIVINPPWQLMTEMQTALPFLVEHLSHNQGHFRAEVLCGE